MGFSMRACLKKPECARGCLLAVVLALSACADPGAEGRFELTRIAAEWSNGRLNVTSEQKLSLSEEASNALIHGVPLTIELELVLRNTGDQTRVGNQTSNYEIRYLPLSNYYQLAFSGTDTVKTFPRLRHVLAELSHLDVSVETGTVPAGDYELLARISLDQNRMPPPMRLPALLSAKWHHDSAWSSWPLQIEPGV